MKKIGENFASNIRHRRNLLGLSLQELAKKSGVSAAMLSEVERGLKSPTLRVAVLIARGLESSVSDLLGDSPEAEIAVLRIADRPVLIDPESGVERHSLSPMMLRRGIEVASYVIPAESSTGVVPGRHRGAAEHFTLVRGRLRWKCEGREYLLETGDSVTFGTAEAEGFNPGPEDCEFFLVIDFGRS